MWFSFSSYELREGRNPCALTGPTIRGGSLELASKGGGRIGTYGAENRHGQLYGKHTNSPESSAVNLNASA